MHTDEFYGVELIVVACMQVERRRPLRLWNPTHELLSSSISHHAYISNQDIYFTGLITENHIDPASSPLSLHRMSPNYFIFIFILLLFAQNNNVFSNIDHYLRPSLTSSPTTSVRTREKPEQYFEITPPVPADPLFPSCAAHPIIRHSFANTIGSPPYSCPYTPPRSCPGPWARVVLELSISSRGDQSERIAAMWLGGAELIRTSTAQPTKYGIFWKVRKDVTRYTALLSQKNLSATMMLENIVDTQFTGVYHVNAILYFYNKTNNLQMQSPYSRQQTSGRLDYKNNVNQTNDVLRSHIGAGSWGFYGPPADMIIPISSDSGRGFWFRVENETDLHTKRITIPQNTKQAVLELYVSYHDNDEFWYSNLPQSYIKGNNLTTLRGNGAFREVYVTIDGNFVDSEVPFPVIFTGGINPMFWEPIVAIGAFDMPSYDMNLTPVLETLLDGKEHEFGIAIAHGISYWLVNANLHLWLDTQSEAVVAKAIMFGAPAVQVQRKSQFNKLDGRFQVQASRKTLFMGWVMSNEGNFTTITTKDYKVRNQIMYRFNGTLKVVKQKVKVRKQVSMHASIEKHYAYFFL